MVWILAIWAVFPVLRSSRAEPSAQRGDFAARPKEVRVCSGRDIYDALLVVVRGRAPSLLWGEDAPDGEIPEELGPKLGRLCRMPPPWRAAPRIGPRGVGREVTAAAPIVAALRARLPGACIVLSTSTETGQEMARKIVPGRKHLYLLPSRHPRGRPEGDCRANPDIFVPVETELWPNFIGTCRKRGTRIVMVNGRISPRSFRRYRTTSSLEGDPCGHCRGRRDLPRPIRRGLRPSDCPPNGFMSWGTPSTTASPARVSPAIEKGDRRPRGDRAGRAGTGRREVPTQGKRPLSWRCTKRYWGSRPGLKIDPYPSSRRTGAGRSWISSSRPGVTDSLPDFGDRLRPQPPGGAGSRRGYHRRALQDLQPRHGRLTAEGLSCRREARISSRPPPGGRSSSHGPYMDDFQDERGLACGSRDGDHGPERRGALRPGIRDLFERPDLLPRTRGDAGRRAVEANRSRRGAIRRPDRESFGQIWI